MPPSVELINVGSATKASRRNKLVNFADRSGRVAALLVVAIARYGSSSRLAPHPDCAPNSIEEYMHL
jgi:hypothetical protein